MLGGRFECLLWGMARSEPRKFFGVEVPADERTPLVDRLLRVIEEQRAEIDGLRAAQALWTSPVKVKTGKVENPGNANPLVL